MGRESGRRKQTSIHAACINRHMHANTHAHAYTYTVTGRRPASTHTYGQPHIQADNRTCTHAFHTHMHTHPHKCTHAYTHTYGHTYTHTGSHISMAYIHPHKTGTHAGIQR